LDPPRAGAKEQCAEIAKVRAPVVYISCNPETWARDKAILESGGYECARVVAVDQFAGSAHWELASAFYKQV
jgi:23S rRNA (uracil1939-C5)-methyltransferase